VICEIMNDDGTMARRPELIAFAQRHGLKIATIADLIAYRRRHDRIVERKLETPFHSRFGGDFKMYIYANKISNVEHVALVKGDIGTPEPVLVRMHALNVLDDVLGNDRGNRGGLLHGAMEAIGREGRGVVVLIREQVSNSLSDRLATLLESQGAGGSELRNYGVGAQILLDLGVRDMILLSNTEHTIVGLEGYGLALVGHRPIARSGAS
jgi:3,4-dihydroxy 2-butanone 4-phosphate synthase / GTP cyclohydrolase II